MLPGNRHEPVGRVQDYQTYSVRSPVSTHMRPATCAEFGCEAWLHGFRTIVDEASELGRAQAAWIRAQELEETKPAQPGDQRRRYRESRNEAGLTVFTFGPGQRCFAADSHRVKVGRPEIFIVRGGDWRANTGLIRRHSRAEDWIEDFAGHQDRLATEHRKG